MTEWEYTSCSVGANSQYLAAMKASGWEVVSLEGHHWTFKRPVSTPTKEG